MIRSYFGNSFGRRGGPKNPRLKAQETRGQISYTCSWAIVQICRELPASSPASSRVAHPSVITYFRFFKFNIKSQPPEPCVSSNNFLIKLPLLPGPHYIRVKHYAPDGTGDYVMTLESSEMYDKQADDLILRKTQAYFHVGHVIYTTSLTDNN